MTGYAVFCLVLLLADQLSKLAVRASLAQGVRRVLLPGALALNHVENSGAAFSMFSGHAWIISLLTGALLLGVAAYLFLGRGHSAWRRAALCLVLAGGLGNLIDRLRFGTVTDFIEVLFVRFAVFNVADICITCGAVLLIAAMLFETGGGKKA